MSDAHDCERECAWIQILVDWLTSDGPEPLDFRGNPIPDRLRQILEDRAKLDAVLDALIGDPAGTSTHARWGKAVLTLIEPSSS